LVGGGGGGTNKERKKNVVFHPVDTTLGGTENEQS